MNFGITELVSFDCLNIFVASDVKVDAFDVDEKLLFKMLGLSFFVI